MNELLEALKEDRFTIYNSLTDETTGPWTIQEVAQICGGDPFRMWEHTIELIEVTN